MGGVPNLVPLVNRAKIYNLKDVAAEINMPQAFFIGAGAGSSRLAGLNCEVKRKKKDQGKGKKGTN